MSAAKAALGIRLAPHEIAYLRAVSQGIPGPDAAARYLRLQHGHQLATAHRRIVERASALARQQRDSRWRLLALTIPRSATPALTAQPPTVEAWAASQGLDGWSWDELVAMHAERFAAGVPAAERRRAGRNARLLQRRLDLLRELELAAPKPLPSDRLDAWFAPAFASLLQSRGVLTLADLRARIDRGGRWWAFIPAFGRLKSARLADQVDQLLGQPRLISGPDDWDSARARQTLDRLRHQPGPNRLPISAAGLQAADDLAAMQAWIVAKSGSSVTSTAYAREARRYLLWAALVRGRDLGAITVEDCAAYKDFLADVPASWCSWDAVTPQAAGWVPFRGPLSVRSQQHALTIVRAFHTWLVSAGYLARNPWVLLYTALGDDDSATTSPTSRALTPTMWRAVLDELDVDQSPAGDRLRWLVVFAFATGLRASEIIAARREKLTCEGSTWLLSVTGKGRKRRDVVVPAVALAATRAYFVRRGIDFDACEPTTLLLGALPSINPRARQDDQDAPVAYSAIRKAVRRLMDKAGQRVPPEQRATMLRASLHWLRHTFATRAAEAGVLTNDLQEQLGHADPRTAAAYSRAQVHHRAAAFEAAVGKVLPTDATLRR